MRKGILDYCILLIMSKKESVYTSEIIEELSRAELDVVEGTIYPLLSRMKNSGVLSYCWVESPQGPPRKYYSITDSGRELLAEMETSWSELLKSINYLKQNNQ